MAFSPTSSWSHSQRAVLAAVCDTLFARLSDDEERELLQEAHGLDPDHVRAFCRSSGTDLGAHTSCESSVMKHLPAAAAADLGTALTMLSSRLGMLALFGRPTPFTEMSRAERTQCLLELHKSKFVTKRKLFCTLKGLVCTHCFGRDTREMNPHNHGVTKNSIWATLDYDGPAPLEDVRAAVAAAGRDEFIFTMLNGSITRDTTLRCDVIVIGSGCGGSVVAAELANAGRRVVLLEKGRYWKRSELSGVETDAFGALYELGGMLAAEDSGIGILCGATFGGGSAVNWACSLQLPQAVREEWAAKYGLAAFADGTFEASMQAITARLGLKHEGVAHNNNNQWLVNGCRKLGFHVETAPQAMVDVSAHAPGAYYLGAGDRYGIKNGVLKTFLVDAASAVEPVRFADRCYVERVLHSGGRAEGVCARVVGADGVTEYRLLAQAPIIVVACGSINSPALLLRSGLPNRNGLVGKNLRLHPVAGVAGVMPERGPEVNFWRGAPMTTVSNQVAVGPHGDHYGAKIECPLTHPGLMSTVLLWQGPKEFKRMALDFRRAMALLVLTRDKGSGEVRIHSDGTARVRYTLCKHDEESLLHGLECSVRIIAAAGAETLLYGGAKEVVALPPESQPEARAAAVEHFIGEIRSAGYAPFKVPIMSAHQMGTCQMGSRPETSVVSPSCELWECSGLYVADASTFPTPSGANPMMTVYGIAHMAAQHIKAAVAGAAAKAPPARL